MSVLTSALMSLLGFYPPEAAATADYAASYHYWEIGLSVAAGGAIVWLLTSGGYQRMQRVMTGAYDCDVYWFLYRCPKWFAGDWCHFGGLCALYSRGSGGTRGNRRCAAVVVRLLPSSASALAPAALLGIPYMCADNLRGKPDLPAELRKSVLNLGVVLLVVIRFL